MSKQKICLVVAAVALGLIAVLGMKVLENPNRVARVQAFFGLDDCTRE